MFGKIIKFMALLCCAAFITGCVSNGSHVSSLAPVRGERFHIPSYSGMIDAKWKRKRVAYDTKYKAGTIVVDTKNRYLYYVENEGKAIRYGVGVGRDGFRWRGTARVANKRKWPTWTPPPAMIRREPYLKKYAGGMKGGPKNPLGARALYLYNGRGDTGYRLHGTNEPRSIGKAMSSGCIRMLNEDVADLYERAKIGTRVVVL